MVEVMLRVAVGVPLGYFVPGWMWARVLGARPRWCYAFIFSAVSLVVGVLVGQAVDVPLTWGTGAAWQAVVAGVGWWCGRGRRAELQSGEMGAARPGARPDGVVVGMGVVAAAALAFFSWRCALFPLSGADASWRWSFLPQLMLQFQTLDFYPPFRGEDFVRYFYQEGVPPLVQIQYWWIFACVGRASAAWTVVPVTLQLWCVLALVQRAAERLAAPEVQKVPEARETPEAPETSKAPKASQSGWLAVLMLLSAPGFFMSVGIGQETGWTALTMAAVMAAVVQARDGDDWRAACLTGLCVGAAALAREYGWAWLFCAGLAAAWRRLPVRWMVWMAGVGVATAGPWYVRNWWITENPFYSITTGGGLFPATLMTDVYEGYRQTLGRPNLGGEVGGNLALRVLLMAGLPLVVGWLVGLVRFRRVGFLQSAGLIVLGLWWQSIPLTAGGLGYSLRVLSPLWVVCAVAAGVVVGPWWARRGGRMAVGVVVLGGVVWGTLNVMLHPFPILKQKVAHWPAIMVSRQAPTQTELIMHAELMRVVPAGARILSDNAYLHRHCWGLPVEVVSVWSPEVAALWDERLSVEEARAVLRKAGIAYLFMDEKSVNLPTLRRSVVFAEDWKRWEVAWAPGRGEAWELRKVPGEGQE